MGQRRRQQERAKIDHVLAGDTEHRPTGDKQLHTGTGVQESTERHRCRKDLLEVVEHEQVVVLPQGRPELIERFATIWPNTERSGDRGKDEFRVPKVGQVDEPGSGAGWGDRADRDPGLADTTGTGQGDDSNIVAAKECPDEGHLPFPADERRARRGQRSGFEKALAERGDDVELAIPV